jgi:hypothetical protein
MKKIDLPICLINDDNDSSINSVVAGRIDYNSTDIAQSFHNWLNNSYQHHVVIQHIGDGMTFDPVETHHLSQK